MSKTNQPSLKPNPYKQLTIQVGNHQYARFPLKTHLIKPEDDIVEACQQYAQPHLQPGDYLFVSEKIVAISQNRAFPIEEIKPSPLAKFLVKFVHKSPYGIGLGSPYTMELAIQEVGALRILFGAFISALTKPLGIKGLFYHIVGQNINAIDGPCDYTLPPYNHYAKLGPAKPNQVAKNIQQRLHHEVVIIDANDLGVNVLGKSNSSLSDDFCQAVFRDNPLGQTSEQTPLCIVRRLK